MRIGKDALVFTKHATNGTKSVGFLSQTFLAEIKAETVLVPIVTWNLDTGTYILHTNVLHIIKRRKIKKTLLVFIEWLKFLMSQENWSLVQILEA